VADKTFDVLDFIIGFEGGDISEAEVVEGFQHLINDGTVWSLQGFYGRTAQSLIEQGFCKPANEWTPQEARDDFEDYIKSL